VLDYENKFKDSVIDEFADAYLAGATPVPCIRCNERVKFRDLLETAKDLDADCMATGHYIQRKVGLNGAELHRAADDVRDQSYFLFSTTPDQLDYLPESGWDVEVKIRSTRPSRDATILPQSDRTAKVTLVAPEEGAAPGQACVFYERGTSRVLGGGWITRD